MLNVQYPPKNFGPLRGPRMTLLPHSARGAAPSAAVWLSSATRVNSSRGASSAPLQPAPDDEPAGPAGVPLNNLLARALIPSTVTVASPK